MRVCDSCYAQYGPKEEAGPGPGEQQQHRTEAEQDLPAEYLASPLSKQPQVFRMNSRSYGIIFITLGTREGGCAGR